MNYLIKLIQKKNKIKYTVLFVTDFLLCYFSTYFFFIFRFGTLDINFKALNISFLCSLVSYIIIINFFKPYSQLHRFFNFSIIKFYSKVFFYYLIVNSIFIFIAKNYVYLIPRSFSIVQSLFFYSLFLLIRYQINLIINYQKNKNIKKSILFGSKKSLFRLFDNLLPKYKVESIVIKDNSEFIKSINGISVNKENEIYELLKGSNIDTFIVALDDDDVFDKHKYIKLLYDFNISIVTFDKDNNYSNLSNKIDIGSLLFRSQNHSKIDLNYENKTILVTGGAGSIGTEIIKQLIFKNAKKIIVLDNSEYNLFLFNNIINDLKSKFSFDTQLFVHLCDISIIEDIEKIAKDYLIDFVYHCAAYKHVPIVEKNINISLKNNFFNTHELLNYCISKNIKNFTLISSDKAVRPTNIMGVTKRLAELSCLYLSIYKNIETKVSIVRFGNVLESSGSVVPIFKNQILNGGPITVTDPQITRYFMSLEEASLLVLQSSLMGHGGEIYLLDMGEPIKILDLAKKMIRLSGRSIKSSNDTSGDIEIVFTGLKKGEKLFEELLIDNNSKKTSNKYIYQSIENTIEKKSFEKLYNDIWNYYEKSNDIDFNQILKNKMIGYNGQQTNI